MFRSVVDCDRLKVAGVEFDFLLKADVIRAVDYWRDRGQRQYVVLTNPHSVMLCGRHWGMRRATTRAAIRLPDGVGIVVAAKLLGYGRRHRVTGPALMLELCDKGREQGYRHFFYGGGDGIAERLVERLSGEFPGLQVAGTYCPPFTDRVAAEDPAVIDRINATRPDIVWVGLGAPKQEVWMAANRGRLNAAAMIGVGAAFDFHSGNVPWAPTWMRKCGMEWAYRLLAEPKRMWRRNLDSPMFLSRVLGQAAAKRVARLAWWRNAPTPRPTPAPAVTAANPPRDRQRRRVEVTVSPHLTAGDVLDAETQLVER